MGGQGSGSGIRFSSWRTKRFVQEYKSLDARCFPFKAMRMLPDKGIDFQTNGISMTVMRDSFDIHHRSGKDKSSLNIKFELSKGHYGNSRYWFQCPVDRCSRRCRKLYFCSFSDRPPVVACRKCHNLVYRSQNKTELDRLIDKKWGLIERLGAESDYIFDKPKRMHWKTFERFKSQIEDLYMEIMMGIGMKF